MPFLRCLQISACLSLCFVSVDHAQQIQRLLEHGGRNSQELFIETSPRWHPYLEALAAYLRAFNPGSASLRPRVFYNWDRPASYSPVMSDVKEKPGQRRTQTQEAKSMLDMLDDLKSEDVGKVQYAIPKSRKKQASREAGRRKSGRAQPLPPTNMLKGRKEMTEQPDEFRTGLSFEEYSLWRDVVERHFSFASLNASAASVMASELREIGVTSGQGWEIRNHIYTEKRDASRKRLSKLTREDLPENWDKIAETAKVFDAPPLCILHAMLARFARPKMGEKLTDKLLEAIRTTFGTGRPLTADEVLSMKFLGKLEPAQQKSMFQAARRLSSDFWHAAEWACTNDLEGSRPKHLNPRRIFAIKRLVMRHLNLAGVTWSVKWLKDKSFFFEVHSGLPMFWWINIQCVYGLHDNSSRLKDSIAKYNRKFGPGMLIFWHGYNESLADELRASGPVWVMEPAAAVRALRSMVVK